MLTGVVGGHDDDAVGGVHHPIQHVQQARQVQLVVAEQAARVWWMFSRGRGGRRGGGETKGLGAQRASQ